MNEAGEALFKVGAKKALFFSWPEGSSMLEEEAPVEIFKILPLASPELVQVTLADIYSAAVNWLFLPGTDMRLKAIFERVDTSFDMFSPPEPKYPVGTYQSIWHEKVGELKSLDALEDASAKDKKNLDISSEGKLKSLKGLALPVEANPLTYLSLVGKIDMMLFVDLTNDSFYLKPNGYAEAFIALYLPERKVEEIEKTSDYIIARIVDYTVISRSFKSNASNINAIKSWISCRDEDIKHDQYELFYWIDIYNAYNWTLEKLKGTVASFFTFIELYDIKAKAYDDVSVKIEDYDSRLDYTIERCRWRQLNGYAGSIGKITWTEPTSWKNTDPSLPNKIEAEVEGYGVVKVSKRHLELVTGSVSFEEGGELTDEQFKAFSILNGPEVSPFARLQYFLEAEMF